MRLVLVDWPRRLSPSALWSRDPLTFAVVVSVLLHALALMLRFAPPAPLALAPIDPQLEVILLNARTDAKPLRPEVAAQASMQGGGDRDTGRARSPLPAELQARDGDDLVLRRRRVAELEARGRSPHCVPARRVRPRWARPRAAAWW